jgi:AraC family transcriptional regulator, transcriptional activator of pobA
MPRFHKQATGALFQVLDANDTEWLTLKKAKITGDNFIVWHTGNEPAVFWVDDVRFELSKHQILTISYNQAFRVERFTEGVAWRYNRDFYCMVDHDEEVSCVGLLFLGSVRNPIFTLDEKHQSKLKGLLNVTLDEFETHDSIQEEMLRMLLKRLIIICTRLYKTQMIVHNNLIESDLDIVRHFNKLVEQNFKTKHRVADYADLMHRSPKTLSNYFALYAQQTPLEIIHARIGLEARRLLIYTDKSVKEIAYELGFEDEAQFSRFFKKQVGEAPANFKATLKKAA